jgi:type III pantothenate kinase
VSVPLLLLDAGNTRLKWARFEDGRRVEQGVSLYDNLDALADAARRLGRGGECWIASVAGDTRNGLIERSLSSPGLTLNWLESRSEQCGVVNHYQSPRQLGVDRWMALLAARQRTRSACLVASVGTAMTVDALNDEGHFLGGVIVPGLALMEKALHEGTALVAPSAGQFSAFPGNTADAVHSGCVMALAGAISLLHARLSSLSAVPPHCLLAGGDADRVMPLLAFPAQRVPDLVLEGVQLAAGAGR